MLLHGDELGRTQGGNNNAYCQDNEILWVDWDRARDFEAFTEFTARLVKLRRDHPVFRRRLKRCPWDPIVRVGDTVSFEET